MTQTKPLTYARARYHDDDDAYIYTDTPPKASSSSPVQPPETAEELIIAMTTIGFDLASDFVIKHGFERVNAAMLRALSRPPGTIRNIPGYIRAIVTTRGPIAPPQEPPPPPTPQEQPQQPANRYLKGKYGHLVRH